MLAPIHQSRILPAQVTQQYLPAITVDTTEVHKLIHNLYNKTIILPATHTVEVSNYVQTPNGLELRSSTNPQKLNQSTLQQPGIPQVPIIQPEISQQPIIFQPLIPQQNLLQPLIPQQAIIQPLIPQQTLFQPLIPQQSIIQPILPQQVGIQPLTLQPQIVNKSMEQKNALFQPVIPQNLNP